MSTCEAGTKPRIPPRSTSRPPLFCPVTRPSIGIFESSACCSISRPAPLGTERVTTTTPSATESKYPSSVSPAWTSRSPFSLRSSRRSMIPSPLPPRSRKATSAPRWATRAVIFCPTRSFPGFCWSDSAKSAAKSAFSSGEGWAYTEPGSSAAFCAAFSAGRAGGSETAGAPSVGLRTTMGIFRSSFCR